MFLLKEVVFREIHSYMWNDLYLNILMRGNFNMNKNKLIQIAQDTITIINSGKYINSQK